MRSMPLAACATLLTAGLGLMGCDDADLEESVRGGTPRVIHGPYDDRGEVEDVAGIDAQQQGTLALVDWSSLQFKQQSNTWDVTSNETFTSVSGTRVCDHEPYEGQPNFAWCSGFLVAPDIVATAGHCMNWCSDTAFVFDFQTENGVSPTSFPNDAVYGCGTVLHAQQTGTGSDWALVQLDRPVVGYTPLAIRESGIIPDNEPIYVIGHPVGLPKKFAGGHDVEGRPWSVVKDNTPGPYFRSNLDTYGGNSGSPTFNKNTGIVEGILVRGAGDWDFSGVDDDGTCVQSAFCADGCPDYQWEDVTRITEIQLYLNCPDDELDEPSNNTPGTATPLLVSDELNLTNLFVCDDDWYAVEVLAGQTLTASIGFTHADGDLDLEVGPIGDMAISNGTYDSELVSYTSNTDQTLYVYVYGYNGAMGAYDMSITMGEGTPQPTTCTDDLVHEDNDAQIDATPLTADFYEAGLQICTDDDDWYVFEVDPWDTLTATTTFTHANGDLDLKLYDTYGIADQSASVTGSETVWYTNPAGGSMWVQVYGYDGAENQYALDVTVEAAPVCVEDGHEDNDDLINATPLTADFDEWGNLYESGLQICTGDDDWYSVDLGSNEMLTATILFTHANGDLEASLYFDDIEVDWSTTTSDEEKVEFAPPGGGTVYLQVYGFDNAINTYAMDLAVTAGDITKPDVTVTSLRYHDRKDKLSLKFTTDELADGEVCEGIVNRDHCVRFALGYSHRVTLITEERSATIYAADEWNNERIFPITY
ncbi:MAG: trypsin-like peptidase domain-containing protein [Deltaproteobacteria bacterium]|nr:trypsin-like peptidase domain-containing protein [Deltaproteobacteria bacterium]